MLRRSERFVYATLCVLISASPLASCASPQTVVHNLTTTDPTKAYIGMSKAEIIACAGQPHASFASGSGSETLTYQYSGSGPRPDDKPKPNKDDKKKFGLGGGGKNKDWTCTATLIFEDGKLARLAYAHKDVRSPYAYLKEKNPKKREQLKDTPVPSCTFVLPPSCGR